MKPDDTPIPEEMDPNITEPGTGSDSDPQAEDEFTEPEPNIIDLNNYGMKPYAWRYEGSGGGGGEGGGGYLKITVDEQTMTMDKTWQEIHDAIENGWYCAFVTPQEEGEGYTQMRINMVHAINGEYLVWCGDLHFSTDSADGYPVFVSA